MSDILVVSGVGFGSTTLSAFDAALAQAGIHNFNLIRVSSILPLGWGVQRRARYEPSSDLFGSRLYVVMAETRSEEPGLTLAAGLGWYLAEDGRGLFAEHTAHVKNGPGHEVEESTGRKITGTLRDLCAIRDWAFEESRLKCLITSSTVDGPTSVLVAGVYGPEKFQE